MVRKQRSHGSHPHNRLLVKPTFFASPAAVTLVPAAVVVADDGSPLISRLNVQRGDERKSISEVCAASDAGEQPCERIQQPRAFILTIHLVSRRLLGKARQERFVAGSRL